jgi:hypothetical protein
MAGRHYYLAALALLLTAAPGAQVLADPPLSKKTQTQDPPKPAPPPIAPSSQKAPEPWKGVWKLTAGGKQIAQLSLTDKSIGTIGGSIEGVISDGACAITGTLFSILQGQFPDGLTIRQTPVFNSMSFTATCQDKSRLIVDMLFIAKEGHIESAGGRAIFLDENGKVSAGLPATLTR